MKYNIFLIIILIFFTACEEKTTAKSKVKAKTNKSMDFMINKINDNNDTNKSLSQTFEEDGMVVDGGRDKRLLDAFGMAVAKVIMEDGVYVPTCANIADTKLLTNEECEEITKKYFSYYELYGEDGKKKISNVSTGAFEQGIAGEEVQISSEIIDYESMSDNELSEIIDVSDDINVLNKIKKSTKSDVIQEKVKQKKEYLKEKKIQKVKDDKIAKEVAKVDKQAKEEVDKEAQKECNRARANLNSSISSFKLLENKHKYTGYKLDNNPNNERLIEQFNKEEIDMSLFQSNIDEARSIIDSCSKGK